MHVNIYYVSNFLKCTCTSDEQCCIVDLNGVYPFHFPFHHLHFTTTNEWSWLATDARWNVWARGHRGQKNRTLNRGRISLVNHKFIIPTQVINDNISSSDRATHRETMKNKPRDLHQNWPKPWNLHWLHVILGTKKLQILDIALSLCWKWKYQNLWIKCNHLQNLIKYKSQIRNEFCFIESPLF